MMKLTLLLAVAGLMSTGGRAGEGKGAATPVVHTVHLTAGNREVGMTLVVFADKDFAVRVIDNPAEENRRRFPTLAGAMHVFDCVAGCNGSFFNQNPWAPVGLMISAGRRIGSCDRDSWMKGLLVVRGNRMALESSASFQDTPDITEAIQAGPWLVRNGTAETDNENRMLAKRTFICHDGRGLWAIGASDPCTLPELAQFLKCSEVTTILDIRDALNFDGGPSTGLWCRQEGGNVYLQERWTVRNYVGIVPRFAP